MNTDQIVHTPVSKYFLPQILIHPPSLYTPQLLPECSPECFLFFIIHLFLCSIWVALIGGGSGFPVFRTTLKNSLSVHFISIYGTNFYRRMFPLYRNYPIIYNGKMLEQTPVEEGNFSRKFRLTKITLFHRCFFPTFCHCKLHGWFLCVGNIGR